MPELPDVEAFKEYLDATALHQNIARVRVDDDRILSGTSAQALGRRLKGSRLQGTRRHGKHLFARISGGGWLLLHFGMTGELDYGESNGGLPEYARVVLEFENGRRLAYISRRMLGEVAVLNDADAFIAEHDLGLDALDDAITPEWLQQQFASRPGPVKTALMDQSLIAGIGNVYSDEILFQAGLHPKTRSNRLNHEDLAHLRRTMRRVLRTTAGHQADPAQFPGSYLTTRREKDGRCPKCGGALKTDKVSGRTSYFCPKCQQKR
jgi:formamidopyrimidine-DNA glycosylase